MVAWPSTQALGVLNQHRRWWSLRLFPSNLGIIPVRDASTKHQGGQCLTLVQDTAVPGLRGADAELGDPGLARLEAPCVPLHLWISRQVGVPCKHREGTGNCAATDYRSSLRQDVSVTSIRGRVTGAIAVVRTSYNESSMNR